MKRTIRRSVLWIVVLLSFVGAQGCDLIPPSGPPKDSVSGTIRLSAKLPTKAWRTRTLFIILEREAGGPPLAVQRLIETKFPYRYVITKDDMMIRGRPFSGRVRVRVRLDGDGKSGKFVRGDFEGRASGFVSVGARGVDVLIDKIGTAPAPKVARRPERLPGAPRPTAPSGKTITGVISVAPGLGEKAKGGAVLFLIARTSRPGPPLAVSRIPNPKFPLAFTLSQANVMMQGARFEGEVRLIARLDGDGKVGTQPGDLEGASAGLVKVGASGVRVILRREAGARAQAPPRPPAPSPPGARPQPTAGGSISGTIVLAPHLAAEARGKPVVYLIARGDRPGPPLAVVRIPKPKFPLAFTISQQNVMMPGLAFRGRVRLTARLDADGSAGPPERGDMENAAPLNVQVGARGVQIVVDKKY